MIIMGLDLSINSTGVCIYNTETRDTIYYIIAPKFTQKALHDPQEIVDLQLYTKQIPDKDISYSDKEFLKTHNIHNIVCLISNIIYKHTPCCVCIEGISFQSRGDVVGLAGLNYMVRELLINQDIHMIIVSPTQNKKFATGNGQAEKDIMISAWEKSDPKTSNIPKYIKVDDIADAYFLARYGESMLDEKK